MEDDEATKWGCDSLRHPASWFFLLKRTYLQLVKSSLKKFRGTFCYCLDESKGGKVYLVKFSSPLSWPQAAWMSTPLLSRKVTVGHRGQSSPMKLATSSLLGR